MPAIRGGFQLSAQACSTTSGWEFGQLMGSGSESRGEAPLGGMKNSLPDLLLHSIGLR